jgi:hypothetical protein
LDNAALRAENHLLKRYLNYFENLFAKKSGVSTNVNSTASKSETSTKNEYSADRNMQSGIIDLEGASYQGSKVVSIPVKRDHHHAKGSAHDPSEVSFVLERGYPDGNGGISSNGSNSSGSKIGLFSIALVMCVCCVQ